MKTAPTSIDATLTTGERMAHLQPKPDDTPFTERPTRAQLLVGPDFYSEWNPFTGRCHRIVRVKPEKEGKVA